MALLPPSQHLIRSLYIRSIDRPLSSTVIWRNGIGYSSIILEPKILTIAKALSIQFWLYVIFIER